MRTKGGVATGIRVEREKNDRHRDKGKDAEW